MKRLPHDIPLWIDPAKEVYFVTICCHERGMNQLAHPEVARALFESVENRNERALWSVYLFLLMPDHLHMLLSFPPSDKTMRSIISKWKEWTAKSLKIGWQSDFFEHRLRREESWKEKAVYILENPVRAGLVTESTQWPHFWMAPELSSRLRS